MNTNSENTNSENTNSEKYAWVDAELENRALQEQREYEEQAMEVVEEANPEWNEDQYEDDPEWNEETGMFNCKNCNAEFATDRQLEYHQMVCKPGNNILCADFLERPPPLTRQNACPLTTVVDELTGDIICVEEDQDDALYECKHANILWAPKKKPKTYETNEAYEPIPMEVCDDEDRDYMSENDKLEPRELFPDDEEDELLSVMSDIEVDALASDDEEKQLYPQRYAVDPESADIIFPVFDADGSILPISMELEEIILDIGPAPIFRRHNTQWIDQVTGETVYNGNPNGSRFFGEEAEDNLIADNIIT
jgi:hypothetical protein